MLITSLSLLERRWPPPPTSFEHELVGEALDSLTWTDGPATARAEHRLCETTGAPFAVAFNSCTSAIHAALIALGVSADSTVAIPAFGFAGTVTGARHLGARLLWQDVDPSTLTADKAPTGADVTIAVDTHGVPHRAPRGLPVITDACQSLGSAIDGKPIGAHGVHAWSFSPAKLVTAPDGGAITTGDAGLATELRSLRDYGVPPGRSRSSATVVRPGGHNWRPSEISMALVANRLLELPTLTEQAAIAASAVHDVLDEIGLWRQQAPPGAEPAWHKIRFGPADLDPALADRWERELAGRGVPTHRWGTVPLPRHPAFGGHAEDIPEAERVAAGTLCLGTEACPPMTWTEAELVYVRDVFHTIAEELL